MGTRPSPARKNWKADATRLCGLFGEIASACGLKAATYDEAVAAVKQMAIDLSGADNNLSRMSQALGDLESRHKKLAGASKRIQARNEQLADLTREADAIIVALSALLPVGAHARALEERKARQNTMMSGIGSSGLFGASIRNEPPPPPPLAEEQAHDLGADALNLARTWRQSLTKLAATEVADSEEIPF